MVAITHLYKKEGSATALEEQVDKHFQELSGKLESLHALKALRFSSAKDLDVGGGRKALLIYFPPTQLAKYRVLQKTLTDELEKKMSTTHCCVVILANRTMVSSMTWARSTNKSGLRPRNRSLKAVQEAILDDLVFPSEIVGKRIKVKTSGDRIITVQLSAKDKESVTDRADVIQSIYKALTAKQIALDI